MPSSSAAARALARSREAIAVTWQVSVAWMAGITLAVAMFATPSTPSAPSPSRAPFCPTRAGLSTTARQAASGGRTMNPAGTGRPRTLPAMVAGMVAGIALTAGAAWWTADLVRGDAPTEPLGPPAYRLVTAEAGVDHTYDGEFEFFVGGGVAIFDCDGDFLPDMYLAGGENPARL